MKTFYWLISICLLLGCGEDKRTRALYQSGAFTVYPDRVVQDSFEAVAISAQKIISNYESPANTFQDARIRLKFSINGKDNEMLPGTDHLINVKAKDGRAVSPVIEFGKQQEDAAEAGLFLEPETAFTIRLNMQSVLAAFEKDGYYLTAKGDKIFKQDFKAVYVAGSVLPMTWDFDNLKNRPELALKDADGDGIYETTLILNATRDQKKIDSVWQLSRDIAAFPQYGSPHILADAIYNMSLEEMEKAIEKDSTLRTGAEWAGVWTRDVSYSIILSMAYMQPQVAKNSLRRKVNMRKRIIQDTGTGGAWPISTDRMIWAVAAWEIFLVTGDKEWLAEAYEVISNSLQDDYKVAYDDATGLVKGESSFLDWREQTYPKWMQPADIFESICIGTNAAHYQANMVAQKMAHWLNKPAEAQTFEQKAMAIRQGINRYLWQPDLGFYGQFLYGESNRVLSPRSEALGEALAILFDIADKPQQQRIVAATPVVSFGIPCIYPQIPGIPPYHNNGIWPFVQTYWLLAAAKAGNEASVMHSIASIYRPSALFLTNKENFVADNGDFSATVINSSNMLWSLSGNIALVHKVLFGISFTENGLTFSPFVPSALQGLRTLKGFRYRNAIMNIEVEGFGDAIAAASIDGVATDTLIIPQDMSGQHTIKIKLNGRFRQSGKINLVPNAFSPATPLWSSMYDTAKQLRWNAATGTVGFKVFLNGKAEAISQTPEFTLPGDNFSGIVQVQGMDAENQLSFLSAPRMINGTKRMINLQAEDFAQPSNLPYKGFEGSGFVAITRTTNRIIRFKTTITDSGYYRLKVRYANGNGPINTENKCAIRSLYANNKFIGSLVFPQRGTQEWSDWGYSNPLNLYLAPGTHTITLQMEDWNENMNGDINEAMIDALHLIPAMRL